MSNPITFAAATGSPRPAARFIVLVLALFAALTAPSAALASGSATDQEAPVLQPGGSADPFFAFAPQQVTATFRITDNESGAAVPDVTAIADNAPFTAVAATSRRISGDGKDSLYTATVTLPAGAVGGGWSFRIKKLEDHVGNVALGNWEAADFFVIGLGWDTTPPTLVSTAFTPGSVDLVAGAASSTVTLKVTDDYTGTKAPVVEATSPDGLTTVTATAALTAGDKNNGAWTATVTIPATGQLGAWTLRVLPLRDEWGNTAATSTAIGSLTVVKSTGGGTGGTGTGTGGSTGSGGGSTTTTTNTTSSTTTATTPPAQGGVLGARANSLSYLTFVGSAKKLKVSTKGSLSFSLKCNGTKACKGSVRFYAKVKGKKYKVVSRRVSVGAGKTTKVIFKLTKNGKKYVKRGKTIKTSLSIWTDGIKAPRTRALSFKRA